MHYYENDLPTINEIVFVKVYKIGKDAIYCKLIEYGNAEGFLPKTELDKGTYNNAEGVFKEKKIYPMAIIPIFDATTGEALIADKNGTIQLSYRRVKICERDDYVRKFEYMAKIYRLTNEIATLSNTTLDVVLPVTMWKYVQKSDLNNTKELYTAILDNPQSYVKNIPELSKAIENIESRITRTSMTVHQEFEFVVLCNNAVDVIKEILDHKDNDSTVEYVSAPRYRIVVEGNSEKECDDKIKKCITLLKSRIVDRKIIFEITTRKIIKEREVSLKFLQQA